VEVKFAGGQFVVSIDLSDYPEPYLFGPFPTLLRAEQVGVETVEHYGADALYLITPDV